VIRILFAWARQHERYAGAAVFIGGFLIDTFTLPLLTLSQMTFLLGGYVALAALAIFITHALIGHRENAGSVMRTSALVLPLVGQFFISGALSGLVILYATDSSFTASWPFITLLAVVFISTEALSPYRTRLTFQSVLLFFTLYAYVLFLLPTLMGRVGTSTFIESSISTSIIFGFFLFLVSLTGRARLREEWRPIAASCVGIFIVVQAGYFFHLVPPLPLALRQGAIYHSIEQRGGDFMLKGEKRSPLPFITPIIHHVQGTPLYAFSAVFAPTTFSTHIIHQWEYLDGAKDDWVVMSRVELKVTGGRDGGYRTYSIYENVIPGKWRVAVKTQEGLIIGYIFFTVEEVREAPLLIPEIH
jgi:hypothetical protein